MGIYTVHVAGEQYENYDGSSRQKAIKKCRTGQPVTLVREPDNEYDQNAIKVISSFGQIGYVGRNNAEWLSRIIDEGRGVSAHVEGIFTDDGERHVKLTIRTGSDHRDGSYDMRDPSIRFWDHKLWNFLVWLGLAMFVVVLVWLELN